ncbi:MAG: response regulator [Acidobacteria bacterium]|nr:response regulator [Acidobacteriota bacterium]
MSKILLIDDDQDLIEMNKSVLTQRGHEVQVAFSAAEATEVAKAGPIDLAIVDVMMEDKTVGFELARRLHEMSPEMPMIMLTGIRKEMQLGYTFEPDETWLPVSKFLEKPVNPRVLADEAEALLTRKSQTAKG